MEDGGELTGRLDRRVLVYARHIQARRRGVHRPPCVVSAFYLPCRLLTTRAAPGWTSFLYILDGSLQIGSAATTNGADAPTPDVLPHDAFHTLVLSASADESGVLLRASARAEAILVAGAPLDQGVVQHGPFVMTTADEIRKTLLDCEWVVCVLGCLC